MESFNIFVNPHFINSINQFLNYDLTIEESIQTNPIEINVPSPSSSTSTYQPLKHQKSSSSSSKTNCQGISF
jgi:hypothetical protein